MAAGNKSGARVRAEAAKVVDAVATAGRSLDRALRSAAVAEPDKALLRMLSYGVLRHYWRLKSQTGALLSRPLKSRDSVIEALISVGLFQLADTRVPDHAAVSMTVEATRLLRRPKYAGLVNAVLRNFGRQRLSEQEPQSDEARYDHPQWLIDELRGDWPDRWQQIIEANNQQAPMWLRANERKTTAQDYRELLEQHQQGATLLPGFGQALRLAQPVDVDSLPGFRDGMVSVQDGAAQLAAAWLLSDGGSRILDACAAPGGKTGHLLELASPGATLTAIDRDENRLAGVLENVQRLGFDAEILAADATRPDEWWDGRPLDRILLDAPCSASGVIRRHPDIKLLRREQDIGQMAALQARMLRALWPLLAPSGKLLYVTCSVLRRENEGVVRAFLEQQGDARENSLLPNNNIRDLMCRLDTGFQILPGTDGLDGFYYACLYKTSGTD